MVPVNPSPLHDRRVHATLPDGREVVRYDRAGKWYVEGPGKRKLITFGEAVDLALTVDSVIHAGRVGGSRFDAVVGRALIERIGRASVSSRKGDER